MEYKYSAELLGKTLKLGDSIIFDPVEKRNYIYYVRESYLECGFNWDKNDIIFTLLKLDKKEIADSCYGYKNHGGIWPQYRERDYEAATKLVLFLLQECERKGLGSWKKVMEVL